jgi:hypothetical protein
MYLVESSALYVFLCPDVYAANLYAMPIKKLIEMIFDKEMIIFILLVVVILSLIIRSLHKESYKNKKKELDSLNVKVDEKKDSIRKEEFRKLEDRYEEIRNQNNIKRDVRKDSEEDFDKTMLLSRVELDITLEQLAKMNEKRNKVELSDELEIAENNEEVPSSVEIENSENKVAEVQDDDVSLKDINEELRQEREDLDASNASEDEVREAESFYNIKKVGKNVKNVVEKAIELRKKQITDYAICLNENIYGSENYKTVINTFVDGYIDFKYKRQNEHQYKNLKTYKKLVNNELERIRVSLIKEVNRSYSDEYVNSVFNMFLLINSIDTIENVNVEKVLSDFDGLNFINKEVFIKKIMKIYKLYYNIYFDYYNKLTVDKFELIYNNKVNTENLFEPGELTVTNISSSIQFSKIFSDYIINKTYNSDVILEDIREVQLKLISFNILNDLMRFNNKKKYVISLPSSLFSKERKVRTILGAVNDNFSQSKLFILIDIEALKFNFNELVKLRREGYKFIVQVSAENIKLYDKLKDNLSIADYLVYVGPRISKSIMKDYIPSYLLKKIMYVDKSLIEGVVVK